MCVDRTASTKVPSARESRASVACQKRAAVCAEMLCPSVARVSLMFITLKVTQAERQIYPERIGKVKRAKFHEEPERSSFAGGRNRVLHVPLCPMGRVDHQNNRREDDRRCNNGAQRDRLACDEPAKKQRDDGIHKSICCHTRRCALLQNVTFGVLRRTGQRVEECGRLRSFAWPLPASANWASHRVLNRLNHMPRPRRRIPRQSPPADRRAPNLPDAQARLRAPFPRNPSGAQ